jgi:hypothetical protein
MSLFSGDLSTFCQEVEAQIPVVFSFKNKDFEKIYINIPPNTATQTLQEVLQYVSLQHRLKWSFIPPHYIIIKPNIPDHPPITYGTTLSGVVYDSISKERLAYATVVEPISKKGVYANERGFFTIQVPNKDSISLMVSYMGYESRVFRLAASKQSFHQISLFPTMILTPAQVSADGNPSIISTRNHEFKVRSWMIRETSALFGEADVFRTLQLLPGVQSVGEGSPGLLVKGGSYDQNLVMLDGVQIYNPVHIFGFYSVFNPSIVQNVTLHKDHFPSQYGGRLSSIIDVNTIDGNRSNPKGEVSLGIIGSKLAIDGPLDPKGNTTFMLSGRRSHIDLLLSPFLKPDISAQTPGFLSAYHFYDVQCKLVHRWNNNDMLTANVYTGRDNIASYNNYSSASNKRRIEETDDRQQFWGNNMASLQYNKWWKQRVMISCIGWYSGYYFRNAHDYRLQYRDSLSQQESFFNYAFSNAIHDIGGRIEADAWLSRQWSAKIGSYVIHHRFLPGISTVISNLPGVDTQVVSQEMSIGNEWIQYMEHQIELLPSLSIIAGLHLSSFFTPSSQYSNVQPRLNIKKTWTNQWSLSYSFAQLQQFMHLLTFPSGNINDELWVLASDQIKPQESDQHNISLRYNPSLHWVLSSSVFLKNVRQIIDYKDDETFLPTNRQWETMVSGGRGRFYGLECMVEKTMGAFKGWLSYTYTNGEVQYDHVNQGKPFTPSFIRSHDVAVFGHVKLKEHQLLSASFVYTSGIRVTLPDQGFPGMSSVIPSTMVYLPGERNNHRLPDYNRLDINYSLYKTNKWGQRVWSFGFYNAYNQQNPYYVNPVLNADGERVLRYTTLFPIIPFVHYRQSF